MKSPSKQVMDGRMVVGGQVHLKIIAKQRKIIKNNYYGSCVTSIL